MDINLAIVDDNPDDIELIAAMLAQCSDDNISTRSYQDLTKLTALNASAHAPDVVILNLEMPESGALETISRVRGRLPHIPVVALLASDHGTIWRAATQAGIEDFLVKTTFETAELVRTLHFAITRHRYTSTLFEQANFDDITGLANRYLFRDRLTQALQRADRSDETVALLLIDIQNFAHVSQDYGEEVGEQFLQVFADSLIANVRDSDTVARIGDDEFAIIIEGLSYPKAAIDVSSGLLATSNKDLEVGPHRIPVAMNIGIAFRTLTRENSQHWLIDGANSALSSAKSLGPNCYFTYTEEHDSALIERIRIDTRLQNALENNEFKLYYQAIVATESKTLLGYETLIRWQQPDGEVVMPGSFIASLERLGMMPEVGKFVLSSAIKQHAEWLRGGIEPISVSVNVSASQFADVEFASLVHSLLLEYDLAPEYLSLELTEDLLINDNPQTRRMFRELSELGVKLSIDDFGTGHNSYSYLKYFPISTIKIDRSFTRLLHVDRIDKAIARSQINLARELGMQVVAEGVENHVVLGELETLKPTALQGFLIGRPMPVERFVERFLRFSNTHIDSKMSA